MVAVNTFVSVLAALTTASALAIAPQTPNSGHNLVKRIVHFPEGCDVVCNWDGDKPELPECTWDLCMDNIKNAQCTTAEVTSVDDNSDEARFDSVYSMILFENLTISYRNDKNKRLPYVPWIADQLHATENMDCGTLAQHSGCNNHLQCDETRYAAGYFVLNSFVTIHNLFSNFYNGVQDVRGDIIPELASLGKTFSPLAEDAFPTAVIVDMVTFGYLGAAAPFWNAAMKNVPWFRKLGEDGGWKSDNANTHGTLKDFVNGMVGTSMTLAKDLTGAAAENAVDREMSKLMTDMIGGYSKILDQTVAKIFNGELENTQMLYRMLQDGKFINSLDMTLSNEEIKTLVKGPIYTQLIPRAWRMSNLPVGPFIYDTKVDCNPDGSLKNPDDFKRKIITSEEMVSKNGYCHDGKLYILASAPDPDKHCSNTGDTSGSCWADFQQLPGAGALNGEKWGKVTMKDITHAAVNTWLANGKSNDFKPLDLNAEFSKIENYSNLESDDIVDRVLTNGVHTPGLVSLPVCGDLEAIRGWETGYNTPGGADRFNPWANYPCN